MHRGFGNKTSWAWLVLLAALLATVGFAGCGGDDDDDDSSGADDGIDDDDDDDTGDDDTGDDDDDTSCGDEGETRCDGDLIQTCADGEWADTTDCAEQGPTGLSCVLNPDEGVHECAAASGPETLIDEVSDGDVEDTGEGAWWIDATAGGTEQAASNPWIYVSFNDDGGKVSLTKVDITDVQAETSDAWTLAFKRHSIKINGGDFGGGDIGARKNDGPALDDVRHYVDFGFEQDDYLDEDDNVIPDPIGGPATVLSDWYDYDITTHKLMPKTRVYVLQDNGSGAYAKFEILGYYREFDVTAETTAVAGWFEIAADWIDDAVAANNDDDTLIDASAGGSGNAPTNPPAFFAFAENGVVDGWPGESGAPEYQPDDPATWDLWFKRTDVSNTSAQAGGVLDLGVVDFEDVDAVPDTTPLIENPDLVVAFAGYTPALNLGLTYLIQGGDGVVYKLEAQDAVYAGESPFFYPTSITVRFQPVNGTGTETIFTADVDDADDKGSKDNKAEKIVYYSLANGVVTVDDEATDATWDLKFSQDGIVLNSGDDFAGSVKGAFLAELPYDDIATGGVNWAVGGASVSAIPAWYTFGEGFSLVSLGHVYIVRTAEGYPVKMEIVDYYHTPVDTQVSGWYTIQWAYL